MFYHYTLDLRDSNRFLVCQLVFCPWLGFLATFVKFILRSHSKKIDQHFHFFPYFPPPPAPRGLHCALKKVHDLKRFTSFFSAAEQNVILPVKVRKDELTQIHFIIGRTGKKTLNLPVLSFSSVCSRSSKLHFMQAASSRLPVSKGSWSNNQMVCMKYWVKLGVWAGLCRNLTHFSIHVFVSYLCSNNFLERDRIDFDYPIIHYINFPYYWLHVRKCQPYCGLHVNSKIHVLLLHTVVLVLTFVVTYSLNIDRVEALAIYVSVLMLVWRLDCDVSAINATDYTRKASTSIKRVLDFSNFCICRPRNKFALLRYQGIWHICHDTRNSWLVDTSSVSNNL